ncbi:HAMP domain-containing sensor histidine kinase [Novosphingobium sp. KN65.2]|uniref:sensor histidine kinase n=1 Tax=Novosphingobium sp. KN65.2 TaxID=1478134 RepID=UPI0005E6974F|nr:HAMP domain-containing sensor histidine kinase [Novosphingobium sp. KN65.2]CDO38330.1 putative Sensor protein [Novosphingobium sp. KN65.2]
MKRLFKSAAYRVAFVTSLAFAMATLCLGSAVYYAAHTALARQLDASIEQARNSLLVELRDDGIDGLREAITQRNSRGPENMGYALFDTAGNRIAGQMDTRRALPGWQRITFLDPVEGVDPARALVTELADGHQLIVAADLEPLEQIDHRILMIFGVACLALAGLGALGTLLLGGYLRRRLGRIAQTAGAIIDGDLTSRMEIGPAEDEFDQVAASLNAMLDKIEALVANLRQVTSDLAHDMRTPLARLRNRLEVLRDHARDAENREMAEDAVERADDVLRLFEAMLRISELDGSDLSNRFRPVDLGGLIDDLGEIHASIAEDEGRTLEWSAAPDCVIEGDRELLAQALINLIENALRHTPPGSRISLTASCDARTVTVSLNDDGPGIAEADRKRVFQRFVRLEASRSTPGHGLGLSLVEAIAHAHGASIALRDRRPGLEVVLQFRRRQNT